MKFQAFQLRLTIRLLVWSLISVTTGFFMLKRDKFWKQVGIQFIVWGFIDSLIAVGGQVASERRIAKTEIDDLPEQLRKDKRNLQIALWVNAGLDVLYIAGGLRSMNKSEDGAKRGRGFGVLIQGLFLLIFDVFHALKLRKIDTTIDQT